MSISPLLIEKYNIPAPRYTSYPTVPLWENSLNTKNWEDLVKLAFKDFGDEEGISLYIHLPFCESLCTYCGCTKRITKNHSVEESYIEAILLEWNKYLHLFGKRPKLTGIHLGGGTPTFFSPKALHSLLSTIISSSEVVPDAEFSFEGHPNNTTETHLEALASLGFDRVSYGIQDFDPQVQQAIHRIQPVEKVREATENARKHGYSSVNFDLIYGLPHQTLDTMKATFDEVAKLAPDRIAFYSYAHLPSAFPAQKSFESYLPNQDQKRALYEFGKMVLQNLGYVDIGMDHFAKPNDPLNQAKLAGKVHRNFMGYTTLPAKMLIGLGASSISDIHIGYAQNEKNISLYQESLKNDQWAISKGHVLTTEDQTVKECILDLICRHETVFPTSLWEKLPEQNLWNLKEMEGDGLLKMSGNRIKVTDKGIALVRNICMQLDLRLAENKKDAVRFSKAI
ncbi:MAG: oxygen-independent coproporphyrinogen III oxidase [Algoriphagus sp.]|uniref:oxygen-independent coproporphyrinogen III oxidase n=1 Tax=Algoriphagus sp. TaxID=1872435 RepID=UPI002638C636|nr:oxygen-independent coproporphyrinogen III oxidase [Algoriphagus sp.]MDG1276790.1 oxygen-independent coproporphyrinogen III oxidase [Algoriphagus sp.]